MGQWGKSKCLWENPSNCQLPFLSFSPIIYFCQNVVELVITWNGKSMGKNSNWVETHFWKTCSDFLGKENAQKRMPCCHAYTVFHFSSPVSFTLGFLGAAGVFPVSFIPRFWLLVSFFPWMGGRFFSARDWVVFLTFWELLVHFSIHVFVNSCVFTMAVKGHLRFLLSQRLLASRTGYLGRFSPAVSCAHR